MQEREKGVRRTHQRVVVLVLDEHRDAVPAEVAQEGEPGGVVRRFRGRRPEEERVLLPVAQPGRSGRMRDLRGCIRLTTQTGPAPLHSIAERNFIMQECCPPDTRTVSLSRLCRLKHAVTTATGLGNVAPLSGSASSPAALHPLIGSPHSGSKRHASAKSAPFCFARKPPVSTF